MNARPEAAPPARVTLIESLPVPDVIELEPLAVIERTGRHAWDAWDVATAVMDLDPLQRIEGAAA